MVNAVRPILSIAWLCLVNLILYFMNEHSILKQYVKVKGRFLLCTNVKDESRPTEFLAWDILDPKHATESVVSTVKLLIYRVVMLVFFGFAILYQGLWGSKFSSPAFDWLTYYTNWTFVGFGLFALIAVIVSGQHLLQPSEHIGEIKWQVFHKAFVLIFVTVCSSAIFLTLFYWFVLYDGDKVDLDNPMRHGVNVVFLLVDVLLSRIPIVTYHFQIVLLYGSTYAFFMWIYLAFSGDWVYTALDWNEGIAIVYYVAIPFLLALSFFVMYAVGMFRERFLVRRQLIKEYSRTVSQEPEIELGTFSAADRPAINVL